MTEVARTQHALMLALGFSSYVAQGGDWGSVVTTTLGRLYPAHVRAVHVCARWAHYSETVWFGVGYTCAEHAVNRNRRFTTGIFNI